MGVRSWLDKILKKDSINFAPISVYKLETPDKIIETKIQPIKLPSIVDVGERLALLVRDVSLIKNEMASKTWFTQEFEDTTPKIINLLNEINENLLKLLSKFTKNKITNTLGDIEHFGGSLKTSEYILGIIKTHDKVRYKDIKSQIPISDPTLSKYLKILSNTNKIRKIKVGKAVFYQPL